MFSKQFSEDFFTSSEAFYCSAFVSFHVFAVADYIGSEDNCDLTVDLFF